MTGAAKSLAALHLTGMFLLFAALTFSPLDVQPRRIPDTAEVRVINSEEDWKEFSVETPPAVDFRTHSVIVVFGGERPTGGWRVRITQVDQTAHACKVAYQVIAPPRGAILTQAITHPYAVIRVHGKCRSVTPAGEDSQKR